MAPDFDAVRGAVRSVTEAVDDSRRFVGVGGGVSVRVVVNVAVIVREGSLLVAVGVGGGVTLGVPEGRRVPLPRLTVSTERLANSLESDAVRLVDSVSTCVRVSSN